MLKKKYRISEKKYFDKIYKLGVKIKGKFGMLVVLQQKDLENCEFGIVIGKKIGKAHERNKFKRRIRNIFQSLLNEGFFEGKSFRIIYIAFEKPSDFVSLQEELLQQFKKI